MPDNIRALRGNPGKRPAPKRVVLAPVAPRPPTWLDREAAAEWRRIVPALESIGVLASVDRAVVASYCTAWSMACRASALVAAGGMIVTDPKTEGSVRNPAFLAWQQATATATTLAKELYLTPAARLRSTMPEAPDDGDEGILD